MKILCLFVRHGLGRYPNALRDLDTWYERNGLLADRTLWIVDNSLRPGTPPRTLGPATVLRAGDNHAWEFSGWDSAIEDARALQQIDVVHFVTSAFNTLYTGYLGHFRPEMIPFVANHRVCLGHIDAYPTPIALQGTTSDHWIRSCFFFLSRELALAPRVWAEFADESEVFLPGPGRSFRADAPLSINYQERLVRWLEGGDQGGHSWHSAVGAGEEESRRFRQKTLAILNEHRLSIQLRREGVALADFCWLWATSEGPAVLQDPDIPSVLDQLRVRRSVLGIPE